MRYGGVSGCGGGDYFTSHLKFNKTSESNEWKAFGMDMLGGALDIGMLLGMGALTGAMGPSKKGIAKAADANKAQTANQLSQATAQFKSKYPGAQFSADGKVTSNFESLQKPYSTRLETLNKQLVDAQGKEKAEVTQLKAAKAEYQALSDSAKICNQNTGAMNKIAEDAKSDTYEGVSVGSVIKFDQINGASIDESALEKTNFALDDKSKNATQSAKDSANKLKRDGLRAKAQSTVNSYNNLCNQNKSICQMHGITDPKSFGDDGKGKIGDAKKILDGLSGTTTGAQIKSTLEQIDATQAQLDKLGSKADFDSAAKNINDLVDQLAQDSSVGDARQKAKDAKKEYKDAKKAGLKGQDLELFKQRKNSAREIANSTYQQYFQSRMGDG